MMETERVLRSASQKRLSLLVSMILFIAPGTHRSRNFGKPEAGHLRTSISVFLHGRTLRFYTFRSKAFSG
jgi:hypothetical protein